MSDSLPSGVITEILSRLSVKSLIRFKCVSKTWYSFISSPHFIATHLSRTLSNPHYPSSNLVVFHHFSYQIKKDCSLAIRISLLSLDPKIQERTLVPCPLDSIRDPLNFIGLDCFRSSMGVIGSSNGLFCLTKGSNSYVLYNPCIQKAISLPSPNVGCPGWGYQSLGFGYDPKTDDYKAVRLVDVKGTTHSLAENYMLRTGSWRSCTAPSPPYLIDFDDTDPLHKVFFKGAVHWPARTLENQSLFRNLIVLFDMEDEVFREMAMQKSLQDVDYFKFFMVVVDGLLALIGNARVGDERVWKSGILD